MRGLCCCSIVRAGNLIAEYTVVLISIWKVSLSGKSQAVLTNPQTQFGCFALRLIGGNIRYPAPAARTKNFVKIEAAEFLFLRHPQPRQSPSERDRLPHTSAEMREYRPFICWSALQPLPFASSTLDVQVRKVTRDDAR